MPTGRYPFGLTTGVRLLLETSNTPLPMTPIAALWCVHDQSRSRSNNGLSEGFGD